MNKMHLLKIDQSPKLGLLIPYERVDDINHLNWKFGIRDGKRGLPKDLPRNIQANQGLLLTFNTRELAEATGDTHTLQEMIEYFEKNTEASKGRDECLHEIDTAQKFYTFAYIINLQSQRGRWNFWSMYVPGMTTEEIDSNIPSKIISTTKYNLREIPPRYSSLLKLREKTDFLNEFQQKVNRGLSEEEYFLTKVAVTQLINQSNTYEDFLRQQPKTTNQDKQYLNFMKKWKSPIILIDNNKSPDFAAAIETSPLEEHSAHLQYEVFHKQAIAMSDPIYAEKLKQRHDFQRVTQRLSFKGMSSEDQEQIYELFCEFNF